MINLAIKKRLIMRGYQETIVSDILNNFNIGKPYVLGSCPSSGKTEMAIEVMIRLMESGRVNRVLILAHSTNVLKENFYQRLMTYFDGDVDIMRGQRRYNHNARIQVMIPQNIGKIRGKFDLLVTDEAQHNVLAEDGNYSRIVDMIEPKFQLLLTGTPSKFVLQNDLAERDGVGLPYHINTIGMDMVGFEHFHDVRFDLIKSSYGFTNEDYNQSRDISADTHFNFDETERTINNVIVGVVRNVAIRNGYELPRDSDFVLEGRKLIQEGNFGKTLIMCRNIEQANQISDIISKLFEVKVEVSQSKNDSESENLTKFKNNEFSFLCVVNRAREGYDDNKVVNLIDITMTHNIDLIYQMFCRVVRLDNRNPTPKLYVKVTSNAQDMPEYTMNIMTAALMLGSTENLSRFNGRNFRGIVMPRVEREEPDGDNEPDDVFVDGGIDILDGDGNRIGRRRINELMVLDLIQMFVDDEHNLIEGNDRYAMTTLGDAMIRLSGDEFYKDKEGYFELFRKEKITGCVGWKNNYKVLSEKYMLKYYNNPWVIFNSTVKEFFNECYPNRIFYSSKDGYFNLFIEENIISAKLWIKKYKILSERDNIRYASEPWTIFNQSSKQFFDECYPERQKGFILTKKDYINLFMEENIYSNKIWSENRKRVSKLNGVKYHSTPWISFSQSSKEFFNECFPNRNIEIYSDKEGYFCVIKEENITHKGNWELNYKLLSERDNIRYASEPWTIFNQSSKQFFDECYSKVGFYSNKEGYFKLFRNEKITIGSYCKKYKELSERDGLKYASEPWKLFNQTAKQFSNECYPETQKLFVSKKEDYFKLIRQENIINSRNWYDRYKQLFNIDNKLLKQPWTKFNQSVNDFFTEYRGWLIKNPKKEFNPNHLSEISRINKMGKTTSSEKMNKFFKENPNEFLNYHKLRKENMDYWKEAPYEEIAKKITTESDLVIDFGCGGNDLKKEIPNNKVTSIDHIAIDDNVIACDMSDISAHVNDNTHDVAVFSLSLWGTQANKESYLKEAYRVLKRKGVVYIAEPTGEEDESEDKRTKLVELLTDVGFEIIDNVDIREKFMYITGIKM